MPTRRARELSTRATGRPAPEDPFDLRPAHVTDLGRPNRDPLAYGTQEPARRPPLRRDRPKQLHHHHYYYYYYYYLSRAGAERP